MAGVYVPVTGAVTGATAYVNNVLVARDCGLTLPEVSAVTATMNLMGEFEYPIWQLIQNMQATITKVGIDILTKTMIAPELTPIEFRWTQPVQKLDGTMVTVGCKAFMNGISANIPGFGIEVGSASENDHTMNLTRYRLLIDEQEVVLVDRFAGKVVINGKDYTSGTNALL